MEEIAAAGVDELAVEVHGRDDEERARTRAFLGTLVRPRRRDGGRIGVWISSSGLQP